MDEWAGCGGFRRLKRIERTGARQGCAGKVEGFEGRIGVDTGGDLAQERRAAKRGKTDLSTAQRLGSGRWRSGRWRARAFCEKANSGVCARGECAFHPRFYGVKSIFRLSPARGKSRKIKNPS